ncbi:MAG: hypothetical protein FJX76_03685 [Armatimonadetes bacterium]|nr:hypothetical protein [Armatimonadota bacterium]
MPPVATPIIVWKVDGHLDRFYLPVKPAEGPPGVMIVDCGTPRSWLHSFGEGAEWVEGAHRATIAGRGYVLPGRRVPPFDEAEGLPQKIIGAVGNDFLLAGSVIFDVPGTSMTRLPADAALPPTDGWHVFAVEIVNGMIFLDAELDGAIRRVQLDSGAPASILLRDAGDADDAEASGRDVLGNALAVRKSSGTFKGRTVPLWKMRTFPHLEAVGAATGQKLEGILGLSSLGQKRIVITQTRLFLEP